MKKLTKAEEKVMQALWEIKEGALKDIIESMPLPKPAYNTISTLVRILVEKEFITYRTYGRTNVYSPSIQKLDYSAAEVDGVINNYFNRSPQRLVSFLIKEKNIDLHTLEELLKEIEK